MDLTTDMSAQGTEGISEFYDWLAAGYDDMTSFEARLARERPLFQGLVHRLGIRSVLDAGAGTGFHSLLLSDLGVRVTAVDVSEKMLGKLRQRAADRGNDVRTVVESFENLDRVHLRGFDAVVCLGNSLPHLPTPEAVRAALRGFRHVLRPGGALVLQMLNYERILSEKNRIQNVREVGGRTYVRSYEYEPDRIQFTLEVTDRTAGEPRSSRQTVFLRPILLEEARPALIGSGFTDVEWYGGLDLKAYEPTTSTDLVLIASAGILMPEER